MENGNGDRNGIRRHYCSKSDEFALSNGALIKYAIYACGSDSSVIIPTVLDRKLAYKSVYYVVASFVEKDLRRGARVPIARVGNRQTNNTTRQICDIVKRDDVPTEVCHIASQERRRIVWNWLTMQSAEIDKTSLEQFRIGPRQYGEPFGEKIPARGKTSERRA